MSLCECGCGEHTALAPRTSTRFGHVKGEPLRFINGHNARRDIRRRFWEKVEITEHCWLWRAALSEHGYGVFRMSAPRRMEMAHRVAYEMELGPIQDGLELDHLCRNPRCVSPFHLEPVTHLVNMRRWMVLDGRIDRV